MAGNIEVEIAGIRFRNPLMLASGVVGSNINLLKRAWEAGAGAIVTKTYTVEKRQGNVTPIIVGLPYGYINAVGLENPGIEHIEQTVKSLKKHDARIIVSITGRKVEDFVTLAKKCESTGADAIEINMSCPHVKGMGLEIGMDREVVIRIIKAVKKSVNIPIFPKFGYTPRILDILKQAEIAGADAIVLINTIRSMRIDIWIKKPVLSNKYGGLSGPAIHPIAVACVYQAYRELEIPIIASGGVWTWKDVIEFMLAGANAVQVGSVIAEKGIEVFKEIIDGIKKYLATNNHNSIEEIIGLAHEE